MKTTQCDNCNATISIYASECPICKQQVILCDEDAPSSVALDFFDVSLYKSTIEEITSEYERRFGRIERMIDTIDLSDECSIFYHRIMFFNQSKVLVCLLHDKQIVIPYEQINGYDIIDNSFTSNGGQVIYSSTDTGNMLKRGAVGALLAGSTGAIIGGATASRTSTIEMSESVTHTRLSLAIKTKSFACPVAEMYFETHRDTIQQITAILDIIINNKEEYVGDGLIGVEDKQIYLKEEIRKRHPEIVSAEIESNSYDTNDNNNNSGCAGILMIPVLLGGLFYLLL